MSGRSPGQASDSSDHTSTTSTSESSSFPNSALRGSETSTRPGTSSPGSAPGYLSPYPPLSTTAASSTVRPSTAMTSMQPSHSRMQQSSLATAAGTAPRQQLTQAQKQGLIDALNEHRINTIGELRQIERIFATLGSPDLTQPMTAAWVYYVNSNSLLTELRGLTRNYPFSSECLEEAERRVYQDPASNRSWNYCWLVLAKVHTDRLITTYAHAQASRPEMWGGRIPLAESVTQLAEAFVREWNAALAQFLRYWETAPTRRCDLVDCVAGEDL